ncbi:MAG: hypothetical protein DCC49_11755 [Acidobacteria bacterium]|nr:MAG: hypothetical protein DCC49_11755 [Acidobacteriota bacterium]
MSGGDMAAKVKTGKGSITREKILDAAMALIAERGYAATPIDVICREVNVSPPTIYHHFGSKEGLLAAVVERSVSEWYADLEAAVPLGSESIDRFADAMADSMRNRPDILRLILIMGLDRTSANASVRESVQRVRRQAIEHLTARMNRILGVLGGEFNEKLARFLLVQLDGIFVAREIDDGDDIEELLAMMRTAVIAVGVQLVAEQS